MVCTCGMPDGCEDHSVTPAKRKRSMNQFEFRAFLDLMMCSDPWPVQDKDGNKSGQDVLVWYANNLALEFGFKSWVIAYHEHQSGVKE